MQITVEDTKISLRHIHTENSFREFEIGIKKVCLVTTNEKWEPKQVDRLTGMKNVKNNEENDLDNTFLTEDKEIYMFKLGEIEDI